MSDRIRPRTAEGDAVLTRTELRRVMAMINSGLDDKLTCNVLAGELGVSERYFTDIFRRTLGMTPHRWVNRQRCFTAAELLLGSDLTLAEIAERVGFCSVSAFVQAFGKTFGVTPGAYRRKL